MFIFFRHNSSNIQCWSAGGGKDKEMLLEERQIESVLLKHKAAQSSMTEDCVCKSTF